jgi:phage terminase small subunit
MSKTTKKKELTPKQKRFVEEYLVDLNATQAAIRAGYSAKTAYAIGEENLRKPEIKAAVDEAMAKRAERTEIDQDYVINVIRNTIERCAQAQPVLDAFGNPLKIETPTGDLAAAFRFKEMAVLKGAELLGKHLGMFIDKHELTGKNGQPLGQTSGVLLVPGTLNKSEWEKAAKAAGAKE